MLRAARKPVKRRWMLKRPLPYKPANCLAALSRNRAVTPTLDGALARLYANGILPASFEPRLFCSATTGPEHSA
jgi:hypothetical protein